MVVEIADRILNTCEEAERQYGRDFRCVAWEIKEGKGGRYLGGERGEIYPWSSEYAYMSFSV